MEPFDVWIVKHANLTTGMRIEGFDFKYKIFIDKDKALQYAWKLAKKNINKNIYYDIHGDYKTNDDAYADWPEHEIAVIKKTFNPLTDVCLEFKESG